MPYSTSTRRMLFPLLLLVLVHPASLGADEPDARAEQLRQMLEPLCVPPAEYEGKLGTYRSPLRLASGEQVATAEEWQTRRGEILEQWHKRLGGPWPALIAQPAVQRLDQVQHEDYTEHRVTIEVFAGEPPQDAYLLIPDGPGPFPAVLVTYYEPMSSLSRGAQGQGAFDYGWQLVKRGIVTLSIGTPGAKDLKAGSDTVESLVRGGIQRKRQPLSILAYVAANCHTALSQMPEVKPDRIGIVGLSYGGKWAMFASCLHDKFACAVWSDPGIVFNEKNASVNYWEPWYLGYDPDTQRQPGIPSELNPRTGLYQQLIDEGEDLVSLHSLMSPRPVMNSGGTADPPENWQALNHLIAVNKVLGVDQRVAKSPRIPHVPTPESLDHELAFLEYWLKYGLQ